MLLKLLTFLRCKNSSFEFLNHQLFATVVSQKSELSEHGCMALYSEVFNFLGKDEIKKYMGLCSVFSICTFSFFKLVRFSLYICTFQGLEPFLLKILDARLQLLFLGSGKRWSLQQQIYLKELALFIITLNHFLCGFLLPRRHLLFHFTFTSLFAGFIKLATLFSQAFFTAAKYRHAQPALNRGLKYRF